MLGFKRTEKNEKYKTVALYAIGVFAVCILLVLLAFRLNTFIGIVKRILKAIAPVIWGFAIAYLLAPLVNLCERLLDKAFFKKKKKYNKLRRVLSILITSFITIALITLLIATAIPEILDSVSALFNNMSEYLNSIYYSILKLFKKSPKISEKMFEWFNEQFENMRSQVLEWITNIRPILDKSLKTVTNGVFGFLGGVKDFLLGFIVSIYLLYSKEYFIRQFKKLFYVSMSREKYERFMTKGSHANKIFMDFFVGKAIDSLIIGIICFAGLFIMKMPNAMLISFIIAVTNMIPFFGPFIGAIPSAFLVLLTQPKSTIPFILFIFILQQFDGNILGPAILGNKLNLPTFWVMFAIFFFGNLFGFAGMLLGVPIFAVIYTLAKETIDELMKKRRMELVKRNMKEEGAEEEENENSYDIIVSGDD